MSQVEAKAQDVYSYIEENAARYVAMLARLCDYPSQPLDEGLGLLTPIIEEAIRVGMHATLYPAGAGLPLLYAALAPPTAPVKQLLKSNAGDLAASDGNATLETLGYERALAAVGPLPTLLLYHECEPDSPPPPPPEGALCSMAAADRASLAARLAAIDAIIAVRGTLPVQIKLLVDSTSVPDSPADAPLSPALADFVARYAEALAADACIWDMGRLGLMGGCNFAGQPVIYCGVKGRLAVELQVTGATQDLPSQFATSVANPAWRLVWALNAIKNDSEEILLDSFYDELNPPGPEQNRWLRQQVKQDPAAADSADDATLTAIGVDTFLIGLRGYPLRVTDYYSPSVSITELTAEGGGGLPTSARATLEVALVPDQSPATILASLRKYLSSGNFADVSVRARGVAHHPALTDPTHPFASLVAAATSRAYGQEARIVPVAPISGPLHPLVDSLAVPAIGLGLGSQPMVRAAARTMPLTEAQFLAAVKQTVGVIEEMGALGQAANWGAQARCRLAAASNGSWTEVKIAAAPPDAPADLDHIAGAPQFTHEELEAVMQGSDEGLAPPQTWTADLLNDLPPWPSADEETISADIATYSPDDLSGPTNEATVAPPVAPSVAAPALEESSGEHLDEAVAVPKVARGRATAPLPHRRGRPTEPLNLRLYTNSLWCWCKTDGRDKSAPLRMIPSILDELVQIADCDGSNKGAHQCAPTIRRLWRLLRRVAGVATRARISAPLRYHTHHSSLITHHSSLVIASFAAASALMKLSTSSRLRGR
jgi:acetylornithine deacetylase/succinyl-diaminopimelate desuccinylase-like protein